MKETTSEGKGLGYSPCLDQETGSPPFQIEITGLELLVPSPPSDLDASAASFDSYARDSVLNLNLERPCRKNTFRSQSIETPQRSCLARGHESEDFELSFTGSLMSPIETSDDGEFDASLSESLSYANDSLEATKHKAPRNLPPHSYRTSRTPRRGSLDSCAMDSVQMRRHMPRRYSNFSEYANDSFSLAAKRSQRHMLQSLDQSSATVALADKRDLQVDTTYNFSTVVYETQSIQGGAGRAA